MSSTSPSSFAVSLQQDVKFIALISCILGVALVTSGTWNYCKASEAWEQMQDPNMQLLLTSITIMDELFGGAHAANDKSDGVRMQLEGLSKLELKIKIVIACSAVVGAAGLVQLLMSLWLLCGSYSKEGGGKCVSKLWIAAHLVVLLVIGAAFLCVSMHMDGFKTSVTILLVLIVIDCILLIYSIWIVYSYSNEERCRGANV